MVFNCSGGQKVKRLNLLVTKTRQLHDKLPRFKICFNINLISILVIITLSGGYILKISPPNDGIRIEQKNCALVKKTLKWLADRGVPEKILQYFY
jgi:hypothetical protein